MEPRKGDSSGCRRCYCNGRQHAHRRQREPVPTRRGQRPWHAGTLLAREPGDLSSGHRPHRPSGPHREGEEPKPMMHGREKSDPAIVAEKPPNKVGSPAAEGVEPRAGAEGNARQQRTRRAQNRESVSQALGRVRHARGSGLTSWPSGRVAVSTRGGSRMREFRTSGSMRGAPRKRRPLYVARSSRSPYLLSGEESGEPLASLWPNSPCGRSGPASPSSARQTGRYPGTRSAADPVYKVVRGGALLWFEMFRVNI